MARLFSGNKKSQNDEEAATTITSDSVVPSVEDRLKMFLSISNAVKATVAQVSNSDCNDMTILEEEKTDSAASLAIERHRCRVRTVLFGFLSDVSDALLLTDKDHHDLNIKDDREENSPPGDVFGCVSLLLLNTILLSSGSGTKENGYDARIRHILRSVSIDLITKTIKEEEEEEEEVPQKNDAVQSAEQNISPDVYHVENLTVEGGDELCPKYNDEPILTPAVLTDYLDSAYEKEFQNSEENLSYLAADSEGQGDNDDTNENEKATKYAQTQAAKKFDAIESAVASVLMFLLLSAKEQQKKVKDSGRQQEEKEGKMADEERKKQIIRGMKIGAAGLAAGGLFALTGGLAAPGIAAGLASIGIVGMHGAAILALTHTATIATVFGVYGGNLAAQKMKKRTEGLSEFVIRKEEAAAMDTDKNLNSSNGDGTLAERVAEKVERAELHSTVCVSGWLYDMADFQRPWGVTPTDPPLEVLEKLERFFAVHDPERCAECPELIDMYSDDYSALFKTLRQQYGRDPDHLLPLDGVAEELSDEEDKRIFSLSIVCVDSDGKKKQQQKNEGSKQKKDANNKSMPSYAAKKSATVANSMSKQSPQTSSKDNGKKQEISVKKQSTQLQGIDSIMGIPSSFHHTSRTVWDYQSQYGGGVYTITWESEMLLKICDYMNTEVKKLTKKATKEVLKQTALATLISAVAWPSTLKTFADMIDEPWTIASIRSDEAGIQLAQCLVESDERQPVTLIGYSFGARAIFSCLNELARLQEEWENNRTQQNLGKKSSIPSNSSALKDKQVSASVVQEKLNFRREPASIVEDVVLMGSPTYIDRKSWASCRRIVAGRLVNCYSRKDWILSLMFQFKSKTGIFRRTAGTHPVEDVPYVENVDCSDLVGSSHGDYCMVVYDILERAGFGYKC